jgi:hypothetical protein
MPLLGMMILILGTSANAGFSQTATTTAIAGTAGADQITVTVAPDAGGVEKGLTGTHIVRTQVTERSKAGDATMTVGCVPCFNVYLSFAFVDGRLYAMKPQTDNRRLRHRAFVNGSEIPIEAMNGLRGRDWVDAYGGVDRIRGCAQIVARGEDLDLLARRDGICLSKE